MIKYLTKTKLKINKNRIFGFDIETCNDNKEFVMASIIGEGYLRDFYYPEEIFQEIRGNPIFKNSYIFATNLGFDFFGVYFNKPDFMTIFRGSSLIFAKSYFYKNNFTSKSTMKKDTLKSVTFLDSMNYAMLSVKDMGKIIGIDKIDPPEFLGKRPTDSKELQVLTEYNHRDSEITYKFMRFFIDTIEKLGGTFKYTIGSTSISLFRNKYLKDKYQVLDTEYLIDEFKGYFGGRTEVFKRGYIKDYYYYDFNSLYPSVMLENEYPDPNTFKYVEYGDISLIKDFEGMSEVEIDVPYMKYPILPVRLDSGKVIFPYGKIKGWYTHVELREALKYGSKINFIEKTHLFIQKCSPFKEFVSELYDMRKRYKKDKNKMEVIVKLLLNSCYGKFGQKFIGRENIIHVSCVDDPRKYRDIERIGQYFRVVEDVQPSVFCFPIWSSYITSYGRIKLHRMIMEHRPIYVDTDSLIIDHEIGQSSEIGDLKLEMKIREGIIVRPKFYGLSDDKDEGYVKIKGLGKRLMYCDFKGFMSNPHIIYNKFAKFRESLRNDLIPNEILKIDKEFSLEDDKREWVFQFDDNVLQDSEPILYDYNKFDFKADYMYSQHILSDKFDMFSVSSDITPEEFLKNEIWFETHES